jgi:hypothetical protein
MAYSHLRDPSSSLKMETADASETMPSINHTPEQRNLESKFNNSHYPLLGQPGTPVN